MKTSFYFVIWILIYPFLGLFLPREAMQFSFLIALVIVFALSGFVNRLMPRIIMYERFTNADNILNDVYDGNVAQFKKRLTRQTVVETATAIYFAATTAVLVLIMFNTRSNNWFALIIFGFFAIGAFSRAGKLVQALRSLKANPTGEQCALIVGDVYRLDYAAYYAARQNNGGQAPIRTVPKYYPFFRIVSVVFALASLALGIYYICNGILILTHSSNLGYGATAVVPLLYGILASYYGLFDSISLIDSRSKNNSK